MRVMLVGGAGYLGIPLAELLLAKGHQVVIHDRFYFGEERLDVLRPRAEEGGGTLTLVRGDARFLQEADFDGVDAVIHLAALSNDPSCDLEESLTKSINLDGTVHCASCAKSAGVKRLIFSSSCSIYGSGSSESLTEESPARPVSLYAKLKAEAERRLFELASEDFTVASLRHATAFGLAPRMRFDLVVNLMTLHAFKDGKIFVLGGGEQWRPLVHVKDIARAFLIALEAPAAVVNREAFNVGGDDQNFQVRTIASIVASGVPGVKVEVVPDDPDKRSYHTSFKKIRETLGFEPKHTVGEAVENIYQALRTGLKDDIRTRTLAYYRYLLDAERLVRTLSIDGKLL